MPDGTTKQPTIARIWRGRASCERADDHEGYNYDVDIKPSSRRR